MIQHPENIEGERARPRPVRAPEPALLPPAFLERWSSWLVLAAVALVPFFLPIAPGLRRHPVIGTLGEQLHIILRAAVTLLIYWKGPLRGRLLAAAGTAAFIGAGIEGLQILVGRSALLQDWILDLIGIGLVVGFVWWRGHGLRRGKWLFIILSVVIPAQLWRVPFEINARYECRMVFPELADFESPHNHWLWKEKFGSSLRTVFSDSLRGEVLEITVLPPGRWPGTQYRGFPADWSGYKYLCWDMRLASGPEDSLRYGARVDDFMTRKDRAFISRNYFATRQWQRFSLPIADMETSNGGRRLDLEDVDIVMFYVRSPQDTFVLEIDNLHLR